MDKSIQMKQDKTNFTDEAENAQIHNLEAIQEYAYEDLLSQEMYSYDMTDNENKIGSIDILIHRSKKVFGEERQSYPASWFIEDSDQLKPVLEITGLGVFDNQGLGYGRAALQQAYEMSIELGCEGRIEVPVTWNAGFYEHCGLIGKQKGKPETKCFDPTPDNIEKLYKGGKNKNLSFQVAEMMDIDLDELLNQADNEPEYNEAPINQKIHELRTRMQEEHIDPLVLKQETLKQGLKKQGFSENDMGKTGNSKTGEKTQIHKDIAQIQFENAKQIMLQNSLMKRK